MEKTLNQEFTYAMMQWYGANKRDLPWRADKEPYHIWVSEIMLQQTRVEAVRDYYLRFMKALPDIKALAEADEQTLLKLWQGLGYYNRVRNMHKAAEFIQLHHEGKFPEEYQQIKGLSGIGDYTAGAIASICFDQKIPAVDGNVLRVMSRICESDLDIKTPAAKKFVTQLLTPLYPEKDCGSFTQSLIELGALVCVPSGKPKCAECPVRNFCKAKLHASTDQFPVRGKKKQREIIPKTVFVLQCAGKLAVRKRPEKGLLAGLYELPSVDQSLCAEEAVKQVEEWQCRPVDLQKKAEYRHIFTHVQWDMCGYYFTCSRESEAFEWVSEETLQNEIPLPSAFGYFL